MEHFGEVRRHPALERYGIFLPATALLLLFAVLHTLWATSLDSFTIDEPYHIASGATYLRLHDFRLNPEHPPLVKLAVAVAEPAWLLHLPSFQEFGKIDDKGQERQYTQTAVYKLSDYHRVQRRARFAMVTYNTLLLFLVTSALRRVFSPALALVTLLFLALDPTVSAHMPVVMTDLPLALTGTLTIALTFLAVRCKRWRDWIAFGLCGGALLATKHSAPLILLPLLAGSVGVLLWYRFRLHERGVPAQGVRLASAALLSLAVLWSTYGFRFYESRELDAHGQHLETFNRTLADKIDDLHTPLFQHVLRQIAKVHVLPRAYLWGLADTLRAGVEGRPQGVFVFGHLYHNDVPWWTAFAEYVVKVPLPFTVLALGGITLLVLGRTPAMWRPALWTVLAMFLFLMAFLSKNHVFYAGLRHWLFAVPLLAIFAAAFSLQLGQSSHWAARWIPVLAVLLIALPTLGQRRIWEYHNLLAGGSGNAWRYFDNESVELGQRSDELIAYWKKNILPESALYGYPTMREQLEAEHLKRWEPAPEDVASGTLQGWFVVDAPGLPGKRWEHIEPLRDASSVAHIGNVLIFHGSYHMPFVAGSILSGVGMRELFIRGGDKAKAERYLLRAVQLNPEMSYAEMELGNLNLARGDKDGAIAHYQAGIVAEKDLEVIRVELRKQVSRLQSEPIAQIKPLRLDRE